MLINDSIIRCRYRNGFEHEELMEPGTEYEVTIPLPPTSNVFAAGHRIRVDVSSSNFPRLERNPNTGEPIGRHTHMVKADQTVFGGEVDAAGDPRLMIEWCAGAGGAVPRWGATPHDAFPPDEDETPRRVVALDAFRLSRMPVTEAQYRRFHGDGRRRPVTYVDRAPRRRRSARGTACGCRARRSGRRRRAAATTGSGRGATSCPTASRATSPPGSARPSRSGTARGRVAVRRARHGRQRDASGRAATASCAAARTSSGPERARCSYRRPVHPAARDHYVGFRVAARRSPRRPGSTGSTSPRASSRSAATRSVGGASAADELPRTSSTLPAFELSRTPVTNAQYAAFVADGGAGPPPGGWPRAATTTRDVRRLVRRDARSAPGRAGGCRPRPSGRRPRAAPTARRFPWGDEDDPIRAAVGAGLKHGATSPVGAHPRRREPVRSARTWRATSGSGSRAPTGRTRTTRATAARTRRRAERVLRGGSFMSAELRFGALRDAEPQPPARRQAHIGFRVARGESR